MLKLIGAGIEFLLGLKLAGKEVSTLPVFKLYVSLLKIYLLLKFMYVWYRDWKLNKDWLHKVEINLCYKIIQETPEKLLANIKKLK